MTVPVSHPFRLAYYGKAAEAVLGAVLVVAADFVNQFTGLVPASVLAVVNTVIVVGTAVRVFVTRNLPIVEAAVEVVTGPVNTPVPAP